MKVTDYIAGKIERLPKGYVFTYADFSTEVNQKEAVIKALNRMVASGKIAKLSKGKYYKPEAAPFGNLLPGQKRFRYKFGINSDEIRSNQFICSHTSNH